MEDAGTFMWVFAVGWFTGPHRPEEQLPPMSFDDPATAPVPAPPAPPVPPTAPTAAAAVDPDAERTRTIESALFEIKKVIVGESRTFAGAREFMESHGVEVIDLDLPECVAMMEEFIAAEPELWNEDIGE